jgi:hypothetical protein
VTGTGDVAVPESEDAEVGAAFSERPGVCAPRLNAKIAEEMSSAGNTHWAQRAYLNDKDFLAVADFMAALPPIFLVIRAQAIYPKGGAL